MQRLLSFFQIIRWQNLLFIAITQLLFHYCILLPKLTSIGLQPKISGVYLFIIIVSSICIAAAGNIINDYFDLNIDKINKPNKIIIEKFIPRRYAIFFHLILSTLGIIGSFFVAHKLDIFWLGIANSFSVLLLFIYSASLKKKFLIGNVLVSFLTSWVILVLTIPEYNNTATSMLAYNLVYDKILRFGILYATFSFIISIVREVIKDMEDVEGDRRNGCTTMPIKLGIHATKTFVAVWIIVLVALLIVAQIYVARFGWWLNILYASITLIFPLIMVLKKLFKANSSLLFHKLSSNVKWIMLAGILSMIFFRFL